MVEVKKLVKCYGKKVAVNEIDFKIAAGSIYGFVGPNGAGKTTTIKVITGLISPTSGEVVRDIDKTEIGYMPDFFGVYDNLTVKEYMDFYYNANYLPQGNKDAKIKEMLELVRLDENIEDYVDTLSRGMKQRLCLGRSLLQDPKLLILDEPASGLDPRSRVEMKGILKHIAEMGKTIIISSHILPELAELCTELAIFEKGKIILKGAVEDIMRDFVGKNRFTIKATSLEQEMFDNIKGKIEEFCECNVTFKENEIELVVLELEKISDIIKIMIDRGVKITEVVKVKSTLEEAYMKIVGGEGDE